MWLDIVWAGTGTAADAIQTRFTGFMTGLGVLGAISGAIWKGVAQFHEEHAINGKTLTQMGKGAVLVGGAPTVAPWLVGAAMGSTGASGATAMVGDMLGQWLNPVGPLPVALLYYYWRIRNRHAPH